MVIECYGRAKGLDIGHWDSAGQELKTSPHKVYLLVTTKANTVTFGMHWYLHIYVPDCSSCPLSSHSAISVTTVYVVLAQ